MLGTVVEALKVNEDQGKQTIESMVELTNTHPEIWKNDAATLVSVFSQIMVQKSFENTTRSSATEVILALSQQLPASLRKLAETTSMLIPALVALLSEVEEDVQAWSQIMEEQSSSDPQQTAINAINRLSMDLGEKTILNPCT